MKYILHILLQEVPYYRKYQEQIFCERMVNFPPVFRFGSRTIALEENSPTPNPKTNPNPNPKPNHGAIFPGAIV